MPSRHVHCTGDRNAAMEQWVKNAPPLISFVPILCTRGWGGRPYTVSRNRAEAEENEVVPHAKIQVLPYGRVAIVSLVLGSTRQTPPSSRCPVHWGTGTCSLL
jgi:hypothetical protein